jgi:hypothetical protein
VKAVLGPLIVLRVIELEALGVGTALAEQLGYYWQLIETVVTFAVMLTPTPPKTMQDCPTGCVATVTA